MTLKWTYQWRGVLVAVPVMFSVVCFWWEYENDLLLWPLGTMVFLVGWSLRIWAQQHLGYRIKVPMALTTCGPYALVRNPVYIGNTLIVLGIVVTTEILWMIPSTLLWCAALYSLVVRYEERRLTAKYGEAYRAYQATVLRWLPRFRARVPEGRRRASLGQALLAELHVLLFLLSGVLKEFVIAPLINRTIP